MDKKRCVSVHFQPRFFRRFGPLALALALALAAVRPAQADSIVHIVKPGENLYRIGLLYGVDWRSIMAANGLSSTAIYPGETLSIPGAAPVAPPAPAAPAITTAYVVQPSDSLWLIARKFGLTVDALMAANPRANPDWIYPGQILSIPGGGQVQAAPGAGRQLAVTGHPQTLGLDCESRAAVDWAAYFGTQIGELPFFYKLPASDDPDAGFVGNPNSWWGQVPPAPYGVNAGPVAALLRTYGVSAQAERGLTWEQLRAEIDAGRPVIVWVVKHVGYGQGQNYAASDGHTTRVAAYEHTVIVSGYTANTVTVVDGGAVYRRSLAQFLASWAVLGNMAIVRD